jgi:uncharacterized membrane protein SpoIIM required for sporulation
MLFVDSFYKYAKNAFIDHTYLFIFLLVYSIICWISGYFLADLFFTGAELVDYEYLAQETFYSFDGMMDIIINNCSLNVESYIESIVFGLSPLYDIALNLGTWGVVSRATEHACGDPFLFIKLTFLHGFFEDLSLILNSFAGLILFSFIARFIKDLFRPGEILASGKFSNSWKINKKHLYESLTIFIIALVIMIFAGFLEEYISIPVGNMVASLL